MPDTLTQARLKELLHYNPDTGVFTWLETKCSRAVKGHVAGSERVGHAGKTYIAIGIDGKSYHAHRLAHLYVFSQFPRNQIDHMDGNGTNNKADNLRQATNTENNRNRRRGKNNSSGCVGIYMAKGTVSWRARIKVDGVYLSIGSYKDKFEAMSARKSAENKYGFHKNHGQDRAL